MTVRRGAGILAAMAYLWIGIAIGVVLTIPLAVVNARRVVRKVRALERRALSAERLAELGTLTGGLAHEIKNPLSTINLNTQLLREDIQSIARQIDSDDPIHEPLVRTERRFEIVARETQRLRDILDDFLRFAGRVKLDLQLCDVNHVVSDLADFFSPQARASGVNLRTQLAPAPALVRADPSLLKQAMLNLLLNATQAMTEARAAGRHGGASELIVRVSRERQLGREEIHIHFIDTGPGIAPDKLDKIFQPYFTTKAGGTGLGLPTARRIVDEHGGSLSVHSEPGRGTDFCIAIPVNNVAPGEPPKV